MAHLYDEKGKYIGKGSTHEQKSAKSAALKKKIAGKMKVPSKKSKKQEEKEDAYQHFLYINGLEDDVDMRKRQMG